MKQVLVKAELIEGVYDDGQQATDYLDTKASVDFYVDWDGLAEGTFRYWTNTSLPPREYAIRRRKVGERQAFVEIERPAGENRRGLVTMVQLDLCPDDTPVPPPWDYSPSKEIFGERKK